MKGDDYLLLWMKSPRLVLLSEEGRFNLLGGLLHAFAPRAISSIPVTSLKHSVIPAVTSRLVVDHWVRFLRHDVPGP